MRKSKFITIYILILIISVTMTVRAQERGSLELKAIAEMEVEVTNENGETVIQRVEAAKIVPGDIVIYTIEYTNVGEETAENIYITNPVPEHMFYRDGTAQGEGTVITFSVDGANTFDTPENLTVTESDGTERAAAGVDYTHIRWTLQEPLQPFDKGYVEFRAQLK